jgi:hypothetical protein
MNDRVGLLCLVFFTGRALGMIRLGSFWFSDMVFLSPNSVSFLHMPSFVA